MPNRKSFLLRLDERLYGDLKRWADAEFRSVNGQIEFILRRAVDARIGAKAAEGDQTAEGGDSNPPEDTEPPRESTRPPPTLGGPGRSYD